MLLERKWRVEDEEERSLKVEEGVMQSILWISCSSIAPGGRIAEWLVLKCRAEGFHLTTFMFLEGHMLGLRGVCVSGRS